jgi:hypothetical protein
LLPGQGNGELEICHGFNRFGADIKDDIRALKLLGTGAMMYVAIYHLRKIRCLCCNRKVIVMKKSMPIHTPLNRRVFFDGGLNWIKCDFVLSFEQSIVASA